MEISVSDLRHHFGLPTMEATIEGIEKIADAQALDVISLGIDQDAQENFYHPERQDPRRKARAACLCALRMITAPCIKPAVGKFSAACGRIRDR
jgi:hypothetical protein